MQEMSGERELSYLALGDSYTIGHNVEIGERWPVQLAQRLRGEGANIGEPEIIAVSGWTTSQLIEAIDASGTQGPFDIVSLMIGVNNQYRGLDIGQYQVEFRDLLHRSVVYAGNMASNVIVMSIPDWSVTPFAEGKERTQAAKEIDEFNAINQAESAEIGARYVSVTPISRLAADQPELLSSDGLHPSGAMYSQWVDLIISACRGIVVPC